MDWWDATIRCFEENPAMWLVVVVELLGVLALFQIARMPSYEEKTNVQWIDDEEW